MTESDPALPTQSRTSLALPGAIVIAGIIIAGSILYTNGSRTASVGDANPQADAPRVVERTSIESTDDPSLGSPDAPVTIVEFSDFQCPFCRIFWQDTFGKLKEEYIDTGKVRLIYRDFPLAFHSAAKPAAVGAECAQEQGKFLEYHNAIFAGQAAQGTGTISFTVSDIRTWAHTGGLEMTAFNQCINSSDFDAEIEADVAAGTAAGVSGTPSFFVNGAEIVGAQPYAVFKQMIDEALAE